MTKSTEKLKHTKSGVESVERALRLLEAFNMGDNGLALKELAQRTGLNKATILRLSASLEKFGYLTRDYDGIFHLGASLGHRSSVYRDNLQLGNIIRPALVELVEKTNETAAFHVLRGNSSVVLYCENSKRRMRYHIDEGEINPLNLGSSGKVLEAFVNPKTSQSKIIQDQGYYISYGERDPDIAGITVPILGRDSELIGVISLSGLISRFTDENIESFLEALISTSKKVSLAFGSK
jgi:DNA-binding IclR family transcriptional regulator|tara:strand:- start:152 stop:862 length:711 start_codon:yes stop_codon:yes gene_type:complete